MNYAKVFKLLIAYLSCFYILAPSHAQDLEKMDWFEDAKLGIFIHWGIYAVNGIDESWSFYNNYISYEDCMKHLNGFNDKNYDPEK